MIFLLLLGIPFLWLGMRDGRPAKSSGTRSPGFTSFNGGKQDGNERPMISRKTARAIAELYGQEFTLDRVTQRKFKKLEAPSNYSHSLGHQALYEFLYDRE